MEHPGRRGQQPPPIHHAHRQDGAELDDDLEGLARRRLEVQQVDEQHQVPGRRYREKLGQSRSEEHTSELQSLMRNSYAAFCLIKKNLSSHYYYELHRHFKSCFMSPLSASNSKQT